MASSVLPPGPSSNLVLTLLPRGSAPSSPSSVISTISVAVLRVPARVTGSVMALTMSSSKALFRALPLVLTAVVVIPATASELTEVDDTARAVPATGRPWAVVGLGTGDCVRGLEEEADGVAGFDWPSLSLPDESRDCLYDSRFFKLATPAA